MSPVIRFVTVKFRLLTPRDVHRRVPVGMVLHHVTIVVRTAEPPSLPTSTFTTARTRLRVVVRIHRVRRNLSPRRLVRDEYLELVERQFVQSAVHIRPVLHFLADIFHILEHDARVQELFRKLHDCTGKPMQHPLGESLLLIIEFPVDARLAVFLTAFRNRVIALAFLLDSPVVENERALRPHRLAVKGGESDVALVDVHTDKRVAGVRFGHVELACDRDV